jgi:hypothetical protein
LDFLEFKNGSSGVSECIPLPDPRGQLKCGGGQR